MAILNQKKILNLIPKISAPVTIHVSQGDVGTVIEFTLVKGDETFVDTGDLTASVHGIREDGANFGPFTCDLNGSSISFALQSEMTAVKGSAIAEVVLVDNSGNKVGSANFGILVEESVFPLGVTYDNDVSVYESILNYVQTIPAQLVADFNTALSNEKTARQTADSNEAGTRASAVSNLQAQIDQIIAPSGEAPSEAEVENARVGANNVTYDTLGNAIRGQFSDLTAKTKSIGVTSPQLLDEGLLQYVPQYENGNIVSGADADSSKTKRVRVVGYISTKDVTHIIIKANKPSKLYIHYYNDQYEYVTATDTGGVDSEKIVSIDTTYPYFRTCMICYSDTSHQTQIVISPQDAYSNIVMYKDYLLDNAIHNNVLASRAGFFPISEFPILDQGNIQSGADTTSSFAKRVRTRGYYSTDDIKNIFVNDDSFIRIYIGYFSNKSAEGFVINEYYDQNAVIKSDYPYVRFLFIKYDTEEHTNQVNISPEDIYNSVVFAGESSTKKILDSFEGVREQIGEANRRISVLENANGIDAVPSYYVDYINSKIAVINSLASELTNGDQFIFATDYHGLSYGNPSKYNNTNHMKSLINEIVNNTSISLTVNGGDVANSYQGRRKRAEFLRYIRKLCQYFIPDSYATTLFVAGNHDLGCDGQSGGVSDPVISENDLYINSGLASIASKLVQDEKTVWNYYYDCKETKVRYIILLSSPLSEWGFSNTDSADRFLVKSLLSMDTGWNAVIIHHWPFDTVGEPTSQTTELATLMSNYNARNVYENYDFTEAKGYAPCIIGGHQHMDRSEVLEPVAGYPVIAVMTTTACVDGEVEASTNTREAGTVTEEAFDVFTLDTTSRKLYATRIGGGVDREWSY